MWNIFDRYLAYWLASVSCTQENKEVSGGHMRCISTKALGSWEGTGQQGCSIPSYKNLLSSTSWSIAVPANMLPRCMFSRYRHIPKHYPEIAGVIAAHCIFSAHTLARQGGYTAPIPASYRKPVHTTNSVNWYILYPFNILKIRINWSCNRHFQSCTAPFTWLSSVFQPYPQNTWSLKSPSTPAVKHLLLSFKPSRYFPFKNLFQISEGRPCK